MANNHQIGFLIIGFRSGFSVFKNSAVMGLSNVSNVDMHKTKIAAFYFQKNFIPYFYAGILKVKYMNSTIRQGLLIFLVGLLVPLFYNLVNHQYLRNEKPELLRENTTIVTADDVSYLGPASNYVANNIWKTNNPGLQSYYQRPPGYSLTWLMMLYLGGDAHALKLLLALQLLLHAAGAVMIFVMLREYTHHLVALAGALLFAAWPGAGGFLSYTLTEGITPSLLLLFIFGLWQWEKHEKTKSHWLWFSLAIFSFSFLFITRPVLGVFVTALPVAIWWKTGSQLKLKLLLIPLALLLAFAPMMLWQYRNYNISGRYTGLHPIYEPTEPGIYRPAHQSIWKLSKSWSMHPPDFHTMVHTLFDNAIKGDTSAQLRQRALSLMPERARKTIGDSMLLQGFALYQQNAFEQGILTHNQTRAMPIEIPQSEQNTINHFNCLTRQYRKSNLTDTYLFAPMRVLRYMVFHSNLNLYVFQHPWRGHPLMEMLRFASLGLHLSLFLSLIPAAILMRKHPLLLATAISTAMYIFYLAWIQRGIEERYTLPLIPLLFIFLAFVVNALLKRLGNGKVDA